MNPHQQGEPGPRPLAPQQGHLGRARGGGSFQLEAALLKAAAVQVLRGAAQGVQHGDAQPQDLTLGGDRTVPAPRASSGLKGAYD